ncbi:TrmH family RNA methyltransferase [Halotalea alkalilenta]|uniref:Uncharacterized protein n=1 Tax=Halotalea alkalilenta TaxID=376489 RepID=A0A172YBE8_9GAMM|nr:RNA methyltransferase [Halotalea alkalilenta]ANF56573.1 hypothetical protein A5892_03050 [Halotalea alkalilenta]
MPVPYPSFDAVTITSVANPRVKALRKLKERKYREQLGQHLVEGVRAIADGLDAEARLACLLFDADARATEPALAALLARAAGLGTDLLPTTREVLGGFSARANPHHAVAVFEQRWTALDTLSPRASEVWIALESPRDPGNLGTIIRSCEAAGGAGVILIDDACDPYSPEAMRASTGALFGVRLVRSRRDEFIAWAAREPLELIGTGLARSEDYRSPAYAGPTVLLMGTERDGLSEELGLACDRIVRIPMRGRTDSLNLSVASALMLFEATNRKAGA